jgi:dihydropteroate synthase
MGMMRGNTWQCGDRAINLAKPVVMGIINVTPDSFSDGGTLDSTQAAIAHGLRLKAEGAAILDVGGESTRPGFVPVNEAEELRRVIPVVKGLAAKGVAVSIDTRHASVAQAAIEVGACIINDVTGLSDLAMQEVARNTGVGLVVVRNSVTAKQGSPTDIDIDTGADTGIDGGSDKESSLSSAVLTLADEALTSKRLRGIHPSRIVFDPGFGFVETYEEDLALWANLTQFAKGLHPVLVGVSRKRLVGRLSGIDIASERDEASAQLAVGAIAHGARILRVHNVAATKQALSAYRTSSTVTAYVALGSNLGYRQAYAYDAIARIDALPDTKVVAASSLMDNPAQYVTNQPNFLNGVIRVETRLPLFAFFADLQAIEVAMGRIKEYDKGPRIIDLDLLMYGDIRYSTDELTVPHPGMHERDFVIEPLREVMD